MNLKIAEHPCFDYKASKTHARLHLPLIKSCNISCNYCNRKYSCPNENRPGVTSEVISVDSVEAFVCGVLEQYPSLSVAGIAGPGEVFAEPDKLEKALETVRLKFPNLKLCLSTNGFALAEHEALIKKFKVDFITVTVNTLNISTASKIYKGVDVSALLERQKQAVEIAVASGAVLKVNTVAIPDVNFGDIVEVAKFASLKGAYAQNIMPIYPVEGSVFADIREPSFEEVKSLRDKCSSYIKQISHCKRCRADACGFL